jgi:hypothetical protein
VWTPKAEFNGTARSGAVGFRINNKGYIGVGRDTNGGLNDFWEYDPSTNTWSRKADFGGLTRSEAVGFSIANKGYVGTGYDGYLTVALKDFWEYTPEACAIPVNLRVPKISDTCARLNWNVPDSSVEHIKISYRALGDTVWIEDRKNHWRIANGYAV